MLSGHPFPMWVVLVVILILGGGAPQYILFKKSWLTETENGFIEPNYYAFSRWLDTLCFINFPKWLINHCHLSLLDGTNVGSLLHFQKTAILFKLARDLNTTYSSP